MEKALVTVELCLLVQSRSTKLIINQFDNLIADDGVEIVNVNGDKLNPECIDSKFTKVSIIDDESVLLDRNPNIKYYQSTSKVIRKIDIIRLENKGDFNIILNSNYSFLFCPETEEVIELGNVKSVNEVNNHLTKKFPNYIVLRKVD